MLHSSYGTYEKEVSLEVEEGSVEGKKLERKKERKEERKEGRNK